MLYNVMNGSHYDNPDDVEMVTLDGGISLSVRNDAAFVVDARLSIYEHQSTICPNMPVRSLIYFTVILSEILNEKNSKSKTGKTYMVNVLSGYLHRILWFFIMEKKTSQMFRN